MSKDKPTPKKKVEKPDQLAELQADLQRVQADFINYRRRAEADKGEIMALAKQEVVRQILPMLDTLDRSLAHIPEDLRGNPWTLGIEQTARQIDILLKPLGVERIESLGQPFDPHLHEAITHDPSTGSGQAVDVVTEELQAGYRMGDKVIRHAIVKVGSADRSPTDTVTPSGDRIKARIQEELDKQGEK